MSDRKQLQLVVIMENAGPVNVGASVKYRTVVVPLTEQQQDMIRGRNTWESPGHVHIEEVNHG